MKTKATKPRKSKLPDFIWSRAGLEVRLGTVMALSDDMTVLVRDGDEQMMVYRAKPDEALRIAKQLVGLINRAMSRMVVPAPWSLRLDPRIGSWEDAAQTLREFVKVRAVEKTPGTGRVPTGRNPREK